MDESPLLNIMEFNSDIIFYDVISGDYVEKDNKDNNLK